MNIHPDSTRPGHEPDEPPTATHPLFSDDAYRDADGIRKVVEQGLCHRCGACVGFCPVGTFDTNAVAQPKAVRPCIHCNVCVRVCSGLSVDYPAIGRWMYGERYVFGRSLDTVRSAYIGSAGEPEIRRNGASGGVVTQLLAHWLDTGRIRGAIHTVMDPEDPTRGKGIVARTREDILRGAQSRYTSAPTLAALQEIRTDPGPFALVGLPCQIHALRKRQMMDPRWTDRIPITIGLLCHYNLPCEGSRLAGRVLTPPGRTVVGIQYRQRDERGWPHNTLELRFDDGSVWRSPYGPAQVFNIVSRVSRLGRCLYCLDATADFADLAMGDPWIRDERGAWKYHDSDGASAILARTEQGETLLEEARAAGRLTLRPIPPREVFEGQAAMITEKAERTAWRLRMRRRMRRPVPRYPMPLPRTSGRQLMKELRFLVARLVLWCPPLTRLLFRFALSRAGARWIRHRIRQRERRAAAGRPA